MQYLCLIYEAQALESARSEAEAPLPWPEIAPSKSTRSSAQWHSAVLLMV
jgi:hypothetical protein